MKATKYNLKFDLDGVLLDLLGHWSREAMCDGITRIDSGRFRFDTDPAISNERMWFYFQEAYRHWENTDAFDGARRLVRKVYEMTARPIHIITARPLNFAGATYRSVERLVDVPFNLAMVKSGELKSAHLEQNDILVEDRRRTVLHLAEIGLESILIDKDYNQIKNPPLEITRVGGLHEIIRRLPEFLER